MPCRKIGRATPKQGEVSERANTTMRQKLIRKIGDFFRAAGILPLVLVVDMFRVSVMNQEFTE